MKILITGSHFTPAQAVIEELKKHLVEIVYIGRKYTREGDKSISLESEILPKLGVTFIPIITGRLQRSFTIYTIPSLFKIPMGILQAFYLILREKPDVVLSFGGYVAVPVIISAWFLSIPVIIHEQTLISGLANTISGYFADKIAISFEKQNIFKDRKTIFTGNPIRFDILNPKENYEDSQYKVIIQLSKKEKLPGVLITGGNQGSHVINRAVSSILDDLTGMSCVIHQTGDSKFQDFEKLSEQQKSLKYPERYLVTKWIKGGDFGKVLKNTDLVIGRAGINSLLEIAYFGIPALVIPIPYLYKNEQNVNAQFFENLGLARVLPQKNLTSKNLLADIQNMLKNLGVLKKKAQKAKSVVVLDAAKRLTQEVLILTKT